MSTPKAAIRRRTPKSEVGDDFQVGGAGGDVFVGVGGGVKDGGGHVLEDGVREVAGDAPDLLAVVGFELVVDAAVGSFALLDGFLRDDAGEGEFAVAEERKVALVAEQGNEDDRGEKNNSR